MPGYTLPTSITLDPGIRPAKILNIKAQFFQRKRERHFAACLVTPSQNSGSYLSGLSKPLERRRSRANLPTGETVMRGLDSSLESSKASASVKVRKRTFLPDWASLLACSAASRVFPAPALPRTRTRSFSEAADKMAN